LSRLLPPRSGGPEYGYVLITGGEWTYDRALSQTLVIGAGLFVVLYLLVGFALKIFRIPALMRNYRNRRSVERAHRNIINGLIELIEGHWQKAEQILLKDIENSDTPLLNYLLAARAAQQQDANQRRDEHLKKAHETTPKADVAVGLTQAELQLAHGQTEQALATLTRLRELAPRHPYVLKLLSRLYVQLNEWEKLTALLPELRKRRIVTGEKLLQLERTTYTHLLRYVARSQTVFSLEEQWKLLPKRYRTDPEIFRVFIDCLIDSDNGPAAERHLRLFLNKQWDEQLARRYGEIELTDTSKQLDFAESWLKDHGRSPLLLLSLARLCCRLRLWGKARVYYETSIGVHPTSEAYAELAELLESLGEKDSAYNAMRKGMELAISHRHNRRTEDRPQLPAAQPPPPENGEAANGTRLAANA
jgi:HemY protein